MGEVRLPAGREGAVVTVGTFDGVHRGHRHVVTRLVRRAEEAGLASLLVTFEPHPLAIVRPDSAPRLLSPGTERLEALAETGLDYVAVLSFTAELATYSAERFVQEVLRDRFLMRELLVGHDHGFGRGREAGAEALLAIGARDGFAVEVVPAVADAAGEAISSSGIRRAITQGALDAAAAALGRRYGFAGRVVAGKGRGRTLGVPTLNVALDDHRKLLPPDGVYAVRAQTLHGTFGGMMNLGSRPTFGDESRALEVHLFDADGDWYGTRARVDFVAWLRPTRRFADAQELKAQLSRDAADAHDHLRRAAMTDTDLALTQVPV